MESLLIKSTSKTPEINFNLTTGVFIISGVSVPENAVQFYVPIVEWLHKYAQNPCDHTTITFKLAYLNTSSLQFLYDMLKEWDKIMAPPTATIDWYYSADDDDMKETGEDFKGVTKTNFNLIAVA